MPTPDRTSLAAIVAAGRELLEASGLSGLTMQAVAARVGVRAPSLYKRVKDRDALITAVTESVIDELAAELDVVQREATGDGIAALAATYRTFAQIHPEGIRLMFTAFAPMASLDRAVGPVLRASAALVGDDDALDAARLVTAWMSGFLQMELAGAFRLGGDVDKAYEYGLNRIVRSLAADVLPH